MSYTNESKLLQLRDLGGYIVNAENGLDFSDNNLFFTLTVSTAKVVTIPSSATNYYTAYFEYSNGADVWVLPAATPTLAAPSGTVTLTKAQLRPKVRKVLPGQTLQFLYANTETAAQVVSVSIMLYANSL